MPAIVIAMPYLANPIIFSSLIIEWPAVNSTQPLFKSQRSTTAVNSKSTKTGREVRSPVAVSAPNPNIVNRTSLLLARLEHIPVQKPTLCLRPVTVTSSPQVPASCNLRFILTPSHRHCTKKRNRIALPYLERSPCSMTAGGRRPDR